MLSEPRFTGLESTPNALFGIWRDFQDYVDAVRILQSWKSVNPVNPGSDKKEANNINVKNSFHKNTNYDCYPLGFANSTQPTTILH